MNRLVRFGAPLLLAAGLLAGAGPAYAGFLAGATAITRKAVPPRESPTAVQQDGPILVVRSPGGASRLGVGAIAWNLPVLLCLWAWVVGRRWPWLVVLSLVLVLLHVVVTDIAIRSALGGSAGLPYAFARAWIHWLAAFLLVPCVALARFARAPLG